MQKNMIRIGAFTIAAFAVAAFSPARHVVKAASDYFYEWGINNQSSIAKPDQGGAIELGATPDTGNINPITAGTPYIDFHYGNSQSQDYNARIINDGERSLTFHVQNAANSSTDYEPLALGDNGIAVNLGVNANGSGLKHLRTGGCHLNGTNTPCSIQITWAGAPFKDANYTATCTPNGYSGNYSFYIPDASKTTTGMQIQAGANGFGAGVSQDTAGFNCIAIHD